MAFNVRSECECVGKLNRRFAREALVERRKKHNSDSERQHQKLSRRGNIIIEVKKETIEIQFD